MPLDAFHTVQPPATEPHPSTGEPVFAEQTSSIASLDSSPTWIGTTHAKRPLGVGSENTIKSWVRYGYLRGPGKRVDSFRYVPHHHQNRAFRPLCMARTKIKSVCGHREANDRLPRVSGQRAVPFVLQRRTHWTQCLHCTRTARRTQWCLHSDGVPLLTSLASGRPRS